MSEVKFLDGIVIFFQKPDKFETCVVRSFKALIRFGLIFGEKIQIKGHFFDANFEKKNHFCLATL